MTLISCKILPFVLNTLSFSGNGMVYPAAPRPVGIMDTVDECYAQARKLLEENVEVLHKCANRLLEKERIDRAEFESLFDYHGSCRCRCLLNIL